MICCHHKIARTIFPENFRKGIQLSDCSVGFVLGNAEIGVFASGQDWITLSVETDKESCESGQEIDVTVTVKNTNDRTKGGHIIDALENM